MWLGGAAPQNYPLTVGPFKVVIAQVAIIGRPVPHFVTARDYDFTVSFSRPWGQVCGTVQQNANFYLILIVDKIEGRPPHARLRRLREIANIARVGALPERDAELFELATVDIPLIKCDFLGT
jgi:hypothetical protein